MTRDSDSQWYLRKGHCTICQIEYTAKAESEVIAMKVNPDLAEKKIEEFNNKLKQELIEQENIIE